MTVMSRLGLHGLLLVYVIAAVHYGHLWWRLILVLGSESTETRAWLCFYSIFCFVPTGIALVNAVMGKDPRNWLALIGLFWMAAGVHEMAEGEPTTLLSVLLILSMTYLLSRCWHLGEGRRQLSR